MISRRQLIATSAATILAPAIIGRAQAQSWPNRFVRLVVPFPPGGGTDVVARIVTNRLSEVWGQQMVIENKPAAPAAISARDGRPRRPRRLHGHASARCLSRSTALFPSLNYDPGSPISRR